MYRLRAKRTTGLNPPTEMLFGELAYSDANKRFYIGRPNGSLATFESDLSLAPITDSIAALTVEQGTQNAAIADLTTDLATLDTSQAAQGQAIALLSAASDSQGDAIGQLFTTTNTLNGALVSLEANTQAALETKANDADLATVSKTGAYADLSGKPNLFSGAYADLSGKPTLFSGAYDDLSGKPTIPAGFTYDQQLEPGLPNSAQILAPGHTWRERSTGGLIVGEWEWSGSLWLSRVLIAFSTGAAVTAAGSNAFSFGIGRSVLIESLWFEFRQTTLPVLSQTVYYTIETRIRRDDGVALEAPRFSSFTNITAGNTRYTVAINRVQTAFDEAGVMGTVTAAVGSPGAGRVGSRLNYRLIR